MYTLIIEGTFQPGEKIRVHELLEQGDSSHAEKAAGIRG